MPEVNISIGGKEFTVACQPGEEDYLHGAAGMLDREASQLVGQIGVLPDIKMLLMAGLMLADRTAVYEEKVAALERKLAAQILSRPSANWPRKRRRPRRQWKRRRPARAACLRIL